jgi:hypothetical protein
MKPSGFKRRKHLSTIRDFNQLQKREIQKRENSPSDPSACRFVPDGPDNDETA